MNNELKKIIWNYGDNEYQHIIDNNENEVINFAHYFLVAHSSELIRKSVINKKELNDINYRLLLDTILDIGIYEYSKIVKQYNDISRNIYHNESCIKFVKKIKNEEINEAVSSILKYYNIDQNDLTYANIKNIIESIKNQKTNDDISWYRMIYNQIIKKYGDTKRLALISHIMSTYNDFNDKITSFSKTKMLMYENNINIKKRIMNFKSDLQNTLNSIHGVEKDDSEAKKLFDSLRKKLHIDGRKKYKEIDNDASDGCFAILDIGNKLFYSLSGTKDYDDSCDLYKGCPIKHNVDFIKQSLKLGKDIFGNKANMLI